jgi:hypothetical protein
MAFASQAIFAITPPFAVFFAASHYCRFHSAAAIFIFAIIRHLAMPLSYADTLMPLPR